jgi:hypothetical protein
MKTELTDVYGEVRTYCIVNVLTLCNRDVCFVQQGFTPCVAGLYALCNRVVRSV